MRVPQYLPCTEPYILVLYSKIQVLYKYCTIYTGTVFKNELYLLLNYKYKFSWGVGELSYHGCHLKVWFFLSTGFYVNNKG